MTRLPGEKGGVGGGEGGVGCVMRVVRVSGTMRKVEEEVVRRARREVGRVRGGEVGMGGEKGGVEEMEMGVESESGMGEEEEEDDGEDG